MDTAGGRREDAPVRLLKQFQKKLNSAIGRTNIFLGFIFIWRRRVQRGWEVVGEEA